MFDKIKSNLSIPKVKQVENQGKKGQGLTEFALILPILLLVILGIIEAAWIVWAYITVQNAAREAARYAVTGAPLDALGNPWTASDADRVDAIKQVARDRTAGLPIEIYADQNESQFDAEFDRPRALGILVRGQASPTDLEGTPNHPGLKGLNVLVRVYYNATLLDPLYNALMGGKSVHLNGEVVLQNEGINLALGGELPSFAPPGGDTQKGGQAELDEALEVRLDGVATTDIPAGSDVDIYLSRHSGGTTYYVCFDGTNIPESPVATAADGTKLIVGHNVLLSTSLGAHTFTSSLNADCSNPVATLAVNILPPVNPAIDVNDPGHVAHVWPDNSLLPLIISAHDPDIEYTIYFNGAPMPNDAGGDCKITTDTGKSGTGTCVIPNDIIPGTYPISTTYASNTIDVVKATLEVAEGTEVYDKMWINLVLRQHAPQHNYYAYFDTFQIIGTSVNGMVKANSTGEAIVSYYILPNTQGTITLQTQDDDNPLPPFTQRQIASTAITVTIPTGPVIVAPNSAPAGEVIVIQLRKHSPTTSYDVKFADDLAGTVTTDADGDYLNLSYKIPIDMQGTKTITSFLDGSTSYSATRQITVLATPYILIDGGSIHAPGEKITIRLKNHVANTTYDVYLDLNSDGSFTADELIAEDVVTDGNGEKSIEYTIPLDISPTGTDSSEAHPIISKRDGNQAAATNLYVVIADLRITSITFPANPQPSVDLPIRLHVKNDSLVTLTAEFPFDNDVYFDPAPGTPSYSSTLPPGDQKVWITNIGPGETKVITPFIDVYNEGTYNVVGRTDTSDGVSEVQEYNNMLSNTLVLACSLTPFTDMFDDGTIGAPWTLFPFGDAQFMTSLQQEPAELLAMHSIVDPAALELVGPPPLPVLRATPQPVTIKAEGAGMMGSAYKAQPAIFKSGAAAMPQPAAIPLQQTVDDPTNLAANATGPTQIDLSWNHSVSGGGAVVYIDDHFTSGNDGWTYNDINDPDWTSHVNGSRETGEGNPSPSLRVRTGGTSGTDYNLEGGWSKDFTLPSAQDVAVTLDYRLLMDKGFEGDEYGEARIAIDGSSTMIVRFTGKNPNYPNDQDTGWNSFTKVYANLSAGSHTITLIGFNNKKSASDEDVQAFFDNVEVEGTASPVAPTSFEVERSPDGSSNWSVIATVPYPGAQPSYSYNDTSVACDTEYFYRVRASNGTVYSAYSNVDGDRTDICSTLSKPTNLTATAVSKTEINVAWQHPGAGSTPVDFLNENFDADEAGFSFTKVNNPGYIVNSYDNTQGGSGPGSLKMVLGGVDNTTQNNTEGYWSKTFNLPTNQNVTVQFKYRMIVDYQLESDENGQVRFDVDGSTTTVETVAGPSGSPDADTGWKTHSQTFSLNAGLHTLKLIGFNNKKNRNNEIVTVWFDDVKVSGTVTSVVPDGFELERSPDGSSWAKIATVTPYAAYTSYPDTGLDCNTQYFYRVRAYKGTSTFSDYSNFDEDTTFPCNPFPAPDNLTVVATTDITGDDVIDLNWNDNSSDETEFRIERSLDGVGWTQIDTVPANTTTYRDSTVSCGTQYYYRVVAYRSSDGATVTSNVDDDTTSTCPPPTCTTTGESGGILTLCSTGSSTTQNDDASGGYLFMYQPMNSLVFDMYVKLNSVPNLNGESRAGLEVRDSMATNAKKVELVIRNQNTQQAAAFNRAGNGQAVQQVTGWSDTGGDVPTWLRIQRANGYFYFYYNTHNDTEAPVLGAWTALGSVVDTMTQDVMVGMINSSASGSASTSGSTWEHFFIGCPGEAAATCGAVTEEYGTAVINAINYTDNFQSKTTSDKWGEKSRSISGHADPYPAMYYNGSDYTGPLNTGNPYTNAPMLEYAVNIESPGDYYMWVLGYAPNTSGDSINVGVDGLPSTLTDKVEAGGSGLRWFNTTADGPELILSGLSQGVHIINVWGREDDFELIQILLTTNPDFTPTIPSGGPATYDQSPCLVPVPPEFPPNMEQCTQVLQNTSFESGVANPIWVYPQSESVGPAGFPYPEAGASWSVFMPASVYPLGSPKHNAPYLIQTFEMPAWINSETKGALTLYKAVYKLLNPDFIGINSPGDHLYFVLRDESGVPLTDNVSVATGADNPADGRSNIDPLNPDPPDGKDDWVLVSEDVFPHFLGNPEDVAGQTVQAYFYAPNPGATNPSDPNRYSTNFYLDKVQLNICTKQPEPTPETGKGSIKGQVHVFTGGAPKRFQGVQVWAYKVNGPLLTTYTVNTPVGAENYGFYNLDPGVYVVYSEFVDSDGFVFGAQSSVNVTADQTAQQNLLLVVGGG